MWVCPVPFYDFGGRKALAKLISLAIFSSCACLGNRGGNPSWLYCWTLDERKLFTIWLRTVLKAGIHPELHEVIASCACGATHKTRSTRKKISVEICSECHPFFTGKQKMVDTAGRIERFNRKYGKLSAEKKAEQANWGPKHTFLYGRDEGNWNLCPSFHI